MIYVIEVSSCEQCSSDGRGQTLPSFSYMSIALLACSVLRVLSAHQNKHQDNTRYNGLVKRQCIFNSIQFSFIFRHTYTLAMHNTEVQSKILDSKNNNNNNIYIVVTHENAHKVTTSSVS